MAPSKGEREALCRRFLALGVHGIAIMGFGDHDIAVQLSVEDAGVALVALETYHAGRTATPQGTEQDVKIPDPRETADDLAHAKAEIERLNAEIERLRSAAGQAPSVASAAEAVYASMAPVYREWRRCMEGVRVRADDPDPGVPREERRAAEDALEEARGMILGALARAADTRG